MQERNTLNADVGDVICLKPRGIHLVWNDSDEVTLSLHTYGHHPNYTNRSQFDLESNVVTPFVVNVR